MGLKAEDHPPFSPLQLLREAQDRRGIFPLCSDGDQRVPVVVGVSGGADSVCLLHLLCRLADEWRLVLHVAHLDHNLRAESAQDAAFVADLAARWAMEHHDAQLDASELEAAPDGIEAAARRARYHFLGAVARKITPAGQSPIVAVGHTEDDQAETVVLNLVRGSGMAGLAGMRWVTELTTGPLADGMESPPVRLVRPLLGLTRRRIETYLAEKEIDWREDATNRDVRFLRNRIRHDVMPLLRQINPNLSETLGRTAELLASESDRVRSLDRQQLAALAPEGHRPNGAAQPNERIVLELAGLQRLPLAAQRGVLRLALADLGADLRETGFNHIEEILHQIRQEPRASGPHPLVGTLAWTLLPAADGQPDRLSLHQSEALPYRPHHPYLGLAWRDSNGEKILCCDGHIDTPDGWRLICQACAPDDKLAGQITTNLDPWRAYFDAAQAGEVILTTPQSGMRFAPLGMHGHTKSLGDFFTDQKTPPVARSGWPILVSQERGSVLWVCGQRIAHEVRVTGDTKTVLVLHWEPIKSNAPHECEGADRAG